MFTGAQQQVMSVTDPASGMQPVKQIVQTVTDPNTGKTTQVVNQIITVQDPSTGKPIQQMVDPKTGTTTPLNIPMTNVSSSLGNTVYFRLAFNSHPHHLCA